jgi:hypothetical protein
VPFEMFQRLESWWEQREEFRKASLAALRKREGLPTSEHLRGTYYQRTDGFYLEPPGREVTLDTTMYPNGNGGFTQWATGTRKGQSREEADQHWGRSAPFEILEVSEDGRKLVDELRDLSRDSASMELAERVQHEGQAGEQAPGLVLSDTSDEEIDEKLQQYLKRGPR